MDRYLAHLAFMPDLSRMLYRSRHIYILLAGVLNLGLGAYFRPAGELWRRVLQLLGSLMIVVATILFVLAFMYEPPGASFRVEISRRAISLILYGTFFHVVSSIRRKNRGIVG